MDFIVFLYFALLATHGSPVEGELMVRPRDKYVTVNKSTYFNCSTSYGSTPIFWFHGSKYVYAGRSTLEPYHERFRIDRHAWNGTYMYNLVIHSVQPGDAGEYICADDEGAGEKYSIQLVVLDGDPICQSSIELNKVIGQNTCNVEPDELALSCSGTYHGNNAPQLEWKKVGDDKIISDVLSDVTTNHYNYILRLKGDISICKSSYVCQAARIAHGPRKCIANVINVLYALGDKSIVNRTINDEIICHANTTQSCNYTWRWFQNNDVTTESSSGILKPRKTGLHRCEAECYLRNKTCNLLVMQAMVYGDTEYFSEPSETSNVGLIIALVVVTLLVVALIFVICFCIARKRGIRCLINGKLVEFYLSCSVTDYVVAGCQAEMIDENKNIPHDCPDKYHISGLGRIILR